MKKNLLYFIVLILFFISSSLAIKTYNITQEKLTQFKTKYGGNAEKRVLLWDKMMESAKSKDTLNQLKDVNDFFNKIKYRLDSKHWGKNDYWAAPFEFMGTGAGDCEDYAIAKYYSLKKLGISENKLRITYVKYLKRGTRFEQAHMVLTYYHKPGSTPVVLDNINKKLKLASKRRDLKPIYSFNAQGLWQAKNKGRTSKLVGKNNLKSWKDLMTRI